MRKKKHPAKRIVMLFFARDFGVIFGFVFAILFFILGV